ncbi:hypothetical protein ACLKA7_014486 [Drosophila subpalustris]
MTAETLKPFITPTSAVNNFPAKHSDVAHSKLKISKNLIPIVLSIIAAALVIGILSLTIWQTMRVQTLESDLNKLKRNMESLQQRLGINYLDEMAEFQKEYTNMLIEDPSKVDELESGTEEDDDQNDDDDDDDYDYNKGEEDVELDDEDDYSESTATHGSEETKWDDYLDMINEEKNDNLTNETESTASTSSSTSNEDNVFDDFTSYSEAKKKRERKSRSIADMRNELQSNDVAQNQNQNQKQAKIEEHPKESDTAQNQNQKQAKIEEHPKESDTTTESHHHARKHSRSRQGRQRLLLRRAKSADSVVGTKRSVGSSGTPAAHFHLNRMAPHPHQGDTRLYVGHPTASMGNQWEQHFSVHNGNLTVHRAGLYYVYAQICYNDSHDQNGFIIYHNENAFLQCLNTVPTNMPLKVHTCHTSGLIHLRDNESIHLRDIHKDRNVVLRDSNNRSYFGIIKI